MFALMFLAVCPSCLTFFLIFLVPFLVVNDTKIAAAFEFDSPSSCAMLSLHRCKVVVGDRFFHQPVGSVIHPVLASGARLLTSVTVDRSARTFAWLLIYWAGYSSHVVINLAGSSLPMHLSQTTRSF